MNVTGFPLVLRHVVDLGAVAALLTICTAVGLELLDRIGVRHDRSLDSLLFGMSTGAGIVAAVLLLEGLAGTIKGAAPELTVVTLGAMGFRRLKSVPGLLKDTGANLWGSGGPIATVTIGLSACAGTFLILLALSPPMDWDALMYHLRVPAQFLDRGRIFLPEDNLHAALIGLPHMLYLPLLRVASPAAPALLSAGFTICLSLSAYATASRFWGRACGLWSLLLLWGSPIILLVGATARVDVTVALFLLLAQYALLLALWGGEADRRNVYVAAALAGFAVGVKYHAALYDVMLVPLACAAIRVCTPARKEMAATLATAVGVAGLAVAPYLVKNLLLLGAPLYPFFARPLLEPWLVPLLHRLTVPEGAAAGAFQALAQVRKDFNLADAFFHPGRLTVEMEGSFYFANPLFIVLLLWPFVRRDRTFWWIAAPAVAYLVALIVRFPATNLRYLIPSLAPLTIASVVVAAEVSSRIQPRLAAKVAAPLLAGVALGSSAGAAAGWLSGTRLFSHAVGLSSDSLFLSNPGFSQHWRVVDFINDSLPTSARILEVFEARAYSIRRTVLADPRLSNWPLLAGTVAPEECLHSLGITHVLVGQASLAYYRSRGLEPEALRADALERFTTRCLRPVFSVPGTTLYAIRQSD